MKYAVEEHCSLLKVMQDVSKLDKHRDHRNIQKVERYDRDSQTNEPKTN